MEAASRDKWAEWVLSRSHAGDAEQKRRSLEYLQPIRDRVLSNAKIDPGDVLLDVGAGDGLIAFGALSLVGDEGRVIFSDISEDLLTHCRSLTEEAGVMRQVQFVQASADDLSPIPDSSVDVVTTRSVLIYVEAKDRAFKEFHRVLRPAGRVSIFEPINNYFDKDTSEFWGYDATPVHDLVAKIWAFEKWDEADFPADPMMNFNEADLVRFAEDAGFAEVHADLVIEVKPETWFADWEHLLGTAPNPNAHTVGEAIAGALNSEEATRFEAHLRPLVDAEKGVKRSAWAYLWAVR